jgi:NAD(P)H-dependent FMN reductase
MINLKIITASTRPERKGIYISHWVIEALQSNPSFQVEHLDLNEINLPFLDEPHHPRFQNYTKQHTKEWSSKISEGEAFIFVIPEYNYGYTAPLKNAIDFLFKEWAYKTAGIVSYGGLAGGTRATQMFKQVLTTLKVVPVTESLPIPFFASHIKDGVFVPTEVLNNGLNEMFQEMIKVDKGLRVIREQA